MPYTLSMGLLWYVLALALGVLVGWLMRSVVAGRQVARARAARVDKAEMERLKGRLANLEPLIAERDRLVAELAACQSASVPSGSPEVDSGSPVVESADVARPDRAALSESESGRESASAESDESPNPVLSAPVANPDVAVGASVLGHKVVVDDLKVVEGIGPKIEELCHGIGIRTWFDLAATEVSLLRTMLADAGARFKTHDPATWPEQARLLAEGEWQAFKALTDELSGGRRAD